jgi:uncharacterized protein (DUF1015 family)
MSALFPFRALRPDPAAVATVASVPYDVVSADEARALAAGNPLSFLHVTRSEIDLPDGTNPYDPSVYAQAVTNLEALKRDAPMLLDGEPALYVYRLTMGRHVQTGVAGCFSVDEYETGTIKKHERTRPDKEDDRTRHITELRAQTGLVFLTYRTQPRIDDVINRVVRDRAVYDFVAPDGIGHTVWRITGQDAEELVRGFAALDALYIADGHHRAASAARARALSGGRTGDAGRFVAVAFPDQQVQILPYNRVIKDLGGHAPDAFLAAVRRVAPAGPGSATPPRKGTVSMYVSGRWHDVELPRPDAGGSPDDALDVALLQRHILAPILGIADQRTDKRIDFVGGIRGTAELERVVDAGKAAVAFSMFPVSVDDLMAISDSGGIMPPKSTWFEPKLRDGILVHLI